MRVPLDNIAGYAKWAKKSCSGRTMSSEFPYQLIIILILARPHGLKFLLGSLQNRGAADTLFVGLKSIGRDQSLGLGTDECALGKTVCCGSNRPP